MESKLKSFHLETLNRTLQTRNKDSKMPKLGKGPDYIYCEICRPNNFHIADSDHTLVDCRMPSIFIEIFKFFERSHVVLNRYEMCENRFFI